jgi:hypothetical protein
VALLSRDDILSVHDLPEDTVKVPEWGGEVRLRMLNLADRLVYERWVQQQPPDSDLIIVELLRLTLVDAEGHLLFTTGEDLDPLLRKNPAVLLRLGNVASQLNRLTKQEVDATKGES